MKMYRQTRINLRRLLKEWQKAFGEEAVTVKDAIWNVGSEPEKFRDLKDVFLAITGQRGQIHNQKIGLFIARAQGLIEEERYFEKHSAAHGGAVRWIVIDKLGLY